MTVIHNIAVLDTADNLHDTGLFYAGYNYALYIPNGVPSTFSEPEDLNGWNSVRPNEHTQLHKSESSYSIRIRVFKRIGSVDEWRDISTEISKSGLETLYVTAGQLPDAMRLVRDGSIHALRECLNFGG